MSVFQGEYEMKSAGIIGGIGPESTIEYYRLIIAAYRQQKPDGSYPSFLINPQKCAIGSDLNPAPRGATVASMTKSRHRHRSELADLAQGVAKG